MLHNYFTIAFRHLGRQKINTLLHIVGLTLGMTVCLLIALLVRYELSFDAYHEKADRTYRVISKWTQGNKIDYDFSTPFPLANAIRNEMSGVENVSFAHPVYASIVEVSAQNKFEDKRILAVETDFPEIFNIEAIRGDLHKTLSTPYQAALTESTAKKLFGSEDPIGKTFSFKIGEKFEFTVGALIRDFPNNTHLPASILVSHSYAENFLKPNLDGWRYISGTETLLVVPENADLKLIQAQLKTIADKYINSNTNDMQVHSDFEIQPLSDVHVNTRYGGGWVQPVSIRWLWFFGLIGIAVLTLACINFINLSTAQALTRSKEVGVRKSIGAGRFNLMGQFLSEAWLLTFIAGIFALAITQLSLPSMNTLLDKNIPFDFTKSYSLYVALLVSAIFIGLASGIYPAWVISKFNPSITLKRGSITSGGQASAWLRKGLVVTQFCISITLLMVVLIIAEQVNFLRSKNLGFTKENILNIEIQPRTNKHLLFKKELDKIPQVKDVSFATSTPSSRAHWGTIMNRTGRESLTRKDVTLIFGDDRFCKMYGLKLLAGRSLDAADTNYVASSVPEKDNIMKAVVNEELIRTLEFKSNEAAIGERIWIGWNSSHVEIVGVVKNFNTGPLHEAIKPALITANARDYEQAGIKIETNSNIPETIAAIEAAWKMTYPEGIFAYTFLDEQIDSFYKAEERLFILFKIFSGLAMIISCLGLFGLASFTAQSRTKEIGVRKILGASVDRIVVLLSKDLLVLVAVAILISAPLAWYAMNQWLQNYAFRITIGWWIFGMAGMVAVLIALVTISSQAIKAAVANPVESLRSE